jgi:hypothetical protein
MGTTTQSGGKEARTLRPEHGALQAQNQLLRAEVVALRQQAHYHRSQHRRAVARAEELEAQVGVLKSIASAKSHFRKAHCAATVGGSSRKAVRPATNRLSKVWGVLARKSANQSAFKRSQSRSIGLKSGL